jgi:hypothetical protein
MDKFGLETRIGALVIGAVGSVRVNLKMGIEYLLNRNLYLSYVTHFFSMNGYLQPFTGGGK